MKITTRAEPRFFVELSLENAKLIRDVCAKSRNPLAREAFAISEAWVIYVDLLADDFLKERMVNATHSQLIALTRVLAAPGPMEVDKMGRVLAIWSLFDSALKSAESSLGSFYQSAVSVALLSPVSPIFGIEQ